MAGFVKKLDTKKKKKLHRGFGIEDGCVINKGLTDKKRARERVQMK